jgi:hypothetical protein
MKTLFGGGSFPAAVVRARRTVGKRRLLGVVIAFCVVIFGAKAAQATVITASILSVNLPNPLPAGGNGVSQITFTLASTGIGDNPGRIGVSSTAPNRYGDQNAQAGLNVTKVSADAVNVTLTPTRVYKPGENVDFTLTVQGRTPVGIRAGVRIGLRTIGGPPAWFDNSTPPAAITPRPTLPGFGVITRDAEYTAYNDLDAPFSIQHLQYFPDITQAEFDAIDLDAVLAQSSTPPGILLSPDGGTFDQPGLPDPQPGHLFAAVGQLFDSSGTVVLGAFKEAVVTAPTPEPGSLVLVLIGLATLVALARLRGAGSRSRPASRSRTAAITSLFSLAMICGLPLPGPATAAPIVEVQLPNAQFGNLNQNDVDACKDAAGQSFSCGAVAVVNSFAFLQRRYPQVYDESLIPDRNGNHLIDYDELTGAAEEVA